MSSDDGICIKLYRKEVNAVTPLIITQDDPYAFTIHWSYHALVQREANANPARCRSAHGKRNDVSLNTNG